MKVLVGANDRAGRLRPRQQLAMIGGDEVGADLRRDRFAAVVVELGDADPLDRRMARRHLATEQADPSRPHDREPDAVGSASFHFVSPMQLRRSDRILRAEPLGWPPPEKSFGRTPLSELVSLRNEGDVAVITIDNPPVNALSHAMRERPRRGAVAGARRCRT